MTTAIKIIERASGRERLVVRAVESFVRNGREEALEIAIERREPGTWVRKFYLAIQPGEVFELSDAIAMHCRKLLGSKGAA